MMLLSKAAQVLGGKLLGEDVEFSAVSTDSRAISAAETLLGIVEGWHLGERVGSATAGTNGNVNYTMLPGGYRVVWTGMKVLKHDGTRHHGIGILPTVLVARTISGVSLGRDEVLDRALSLMPEEPPRGPSPPGDLAPGP